MSDHAVLARARTDALDRLIQADEPLAGLHRRCGGDLPGIVAIPQLLEIVRKARTLGLRLARPMIAFDGEELVRAWVEIAPTTNEGEGGCSIAVASWTRAPVTPTSDREGADRKIAIDRELAELSARLDPAQHAITVENHAPDLAGLARVLEADRSSSWSEHVTFPDLAGRQRQHWRILDGARCTIEGSNRQWTVTLVPLGQPEPGSAGFELLLVADAPLPEVIANSPPQHAPPLPAFGRDMTPILRQPIARIIANAETIRSRLAGPLTDEYSNYAADIAAAGQHLLSLVDDLADLEVVEAPSFVTLPDRIDLADAARRAAGILGVRASAKSIELTTPPESIHAPAIGEFRRVLQILLNLVGNAINYTPPGSRVTLEVEADAQAARIIVADEGPGLTAEQAAKVFDKFERLGRAGDGGSGLGLYISRRLARAMRGELSVTSVPGEGARFVLELPRAD